jgi:hypothetical protein
LWLTKNLKIQERLAFHLTNTDALEEFNCQWLVFFRISSKLSMGAQVQTHSIWGKRILIDVFLVVIQSVQAEEARFLRCLEA